VYHQRSKHQLQRYAAGPDTLDWDAQPDPFRRWLGSELTLLPLVADDLTPTWADLWRPAGIAPQPLTRTSLAGMLELSFGLAAWKQQGQDRWAVRCSPSSGNLHPTEAWLLATGVPDLAAGLYHYAPREHGLELRAAFDAPAGAPRAFIALSSIHWREACKYGERAFRYCQLDIGHALGALRYAAALQGWRLVTQSLGGSDLAHRLGLDRDADFGPAEREDAELIIELLPSHRADPDPATAALPDWAASATWFGQASRLDRHPMYR
jgi:SagB-type dehydrogenase family enzyme